MPTNYAVELPDVNYFTRQVLCREGCPVRTDSGGYVQAIAEGRYEDAYIIARTPNPFASICGRVCAAPCEAKCRRGALDSAISIRALKRFVCESMASSPTTLTWGGSIRNCAGRIAELLVVVVKWPSSGRGRLVYPAPMSWR